MKTDNEMTNLESLQSTYSDIHKDVYGTRPRHDTAEDWNSESFLESAIADLVIRLDEVVKQEEEDQKQAIARFENQIERMRRRRIDRATALGWVHDAEGTDGDNEYLCYKLGLPYGYFVKFSNITKEAVVT